MPSLAGDIFKSFPFCQKRSSEQMIVGRDDHDPLCQWICFLFDQCFGIADILHGVIALILKQDPAFFNSLLQKIILTALRFTDRFIWPLCPRAYDKGILVFKKVGIGTVEPCLKVIGWSILIHARTKDDQIIRIFLAAFPGKGNDPCLSDQKYRYQDEEEDDHKSEKLWLHLFLDGLIEMADQKQEETGKQIKEIEEMKRPDHKQNDQAVNTHEDRKIFYKRYDLVFHVSIVSLFRWLEMTIYLQSYSRKDEDDANICVYRNDFQYRI